jgi:hypothetical protein
MHRPFSPLAVAVAVATVVAGGCATWDAMSRSPSFFVTSQSPGRGADLGGLAGADAYCQTLASSAGYGGRTWRAYLSTTGVDSVNARDRIGRGPWFNVKGVQVAANVDELHGTNHLTKETALTERGAVVMGRGDAVTMHDMLTGSTPDGRATVGGSADTTCGNWTRGGEGSAIVGHHDRLGLKDDAPSHSWNSSHATAGCGMDALKSTGGAGLFYCFAAD